MSRSLLVAIVTLLVGGAFWLGQEVARRAPLPQGERIEHAPGAPPPPLPAGAAAAVASALERPEGGERLAALVSAFDSLGPAPVMEVLALYAQALVEPGDLEYIPLAAWHARQAPEEAFEWALSSMYGGNPSVGAAAVRTWASRDPLAARDAVERIGDPHSIQTMRDPLIRGWYDSGKPGLEAYVQGLPPGRDRQLALAQLIRRLVRHAGFEATVEWVERLPDDDTKFKLNAFRRVGSALALADPERAALWAEGHGEEEYAAGLYRRVGVWWAGSRGGGDPLLWLEGVSPGEERDDAIRETYRKWLNVDGTAGLEFMRARAGEPWLAPAMLLWISREAREDPAAAAELLGYASNPPALRAATLTVGRAWWNADPEGAQAWMDRIDMAEDMRRVITAQRAKRKSG